MATRDFTFDIGVNGSPVTGLSPTILAVYRKDTGASVASGSAGYPTVVERGFGIYALRFDPEGATFGSITARVDAGDTIANDADRYITVIADAQASGGSGGGGGLTSGQDAKLTLIADAVDTEIPAILTAIQELPSSANIALAVVNLQGVPVTIGAASITTSIVLQTMPARAVVTACLFFTSGANQGVGLPIASKAGNILTFDIPFPFPPANGDTAVVLGYAP